MAVGIQAPTELLPISGIRIGTASGGFKNSDRHDLTLFEIAADATVSAVFTTNVFLAAPVIVSKEHLTVKTPRQFVINSGNANAGTGQPGIDLTRNVCKLGAESAGITPEEVLVFSTGVIGQLPSLENYAKGISAAAEVLGKDNWDAASHAIMTTDTVAKGISVRCVVGGKPVIMTGIAKGSGMIRPNMATMLAYIATDAGIAQDTLDKWLADAVEHSFNRITVDGDMSTNDACVVVATGASGVQADTLNPGEQKILTEALQQVCDFLAQAMVRDGEGATKFVTVSVSEGASAEECLSVAYQIAQSPLVKTALFASDPNWGRILAAVGSVPLKNFNVNDITIYIDDVLLCCNGGVAPAYTEEQGAEIFAQDEFAIRVFLNRGKFQETVWTSDLSYDYVKINAEYRT